MEKHMQSAKKKTCRGGDSDDMIVLSFSFDCQMDVCWGSNVRLGRERDCVDGM